MFDFVFDAIDAVSNNGYGNPLNFEKFIGRCCVHRSDRVGFVVETRKPLWGEVMQEVTGILQRECPNVTIVSIEKNNGFFFSGDLFFELQEVI